MRKEHSEYVLMKAATTVAVITITLAVVALLLVIAPLSR